MKAEENINNFISQEKYQKLIGIISLFMKLIQYLQKGMVLIMEKKNLNQIKVEDIPDDMDADDFPKNTIFVWDDHDEMEDDSYWDDVE